MTNPWEPHLLDSSGQEHPLLPGITRLGRAPENEIVIPNRLASRQHAQIMREGNRLTLQDLQSANGTFLNGQKVTAPTPLRDGDQVTIAGIHLRVQDPEMTSREAPPLPSIQIHLQAAEAFLNQRPLALSPKELVLLAYLHQNSGRVCSKDEIGRAVWSEYQTGIYDYQIENLIRRLRQKIEADPGNPQLLKTVRGMGYKLVKLK